MSSTIAKTENAIKVKVISIDSVLTRIGGMVDLLKLDCEGAEWEILKVKDLNKKVKVLILEYHLWAKTGATLKDMLDLVVDSGFSVVETIEDRDFGFIMATSDMV